MPIEEGSLLHQRYRIEKIISKGGMGAVYRALDETLGIAVAVKENFFTSEESTRQFRREATILANLRHPNLPRVTDHFVVPGQGQYLVMDFIEGSDLRDFINQRGTLSEEEVVRIGLVICDALAYLHNRTPAIVHRDIKPGNLKITPSGQVFLVDFGLAKLAQGEATATGAQALTPGYAPPEQYGQGTEPRSDIYAFGATLYAALTGKLPEDGLSRVMGTATLTPIRTHNPQVSPALARVIERSMAIQLTERYQNAEAFKQALIEAAERSSVFRQTPEPVPQSEEVTSMIEPVSPRTGPKPQTQAVPAQNMQAAVPAETTRPRKIPAVAFLGVGAVIVLALVALLVMNLGPKTPATGQLPEATSTVVAAVVVTSAPSETPTVEPSPTATEQLTSTPEPTETQPPAPTETLPPAATPVGGGGGQVAFSSDRSGQVQVWIMNADGTGLTQVTQLQDGACQPDWSPDGKQIVFISPCNGKKDEYPRASLFIINADGTGLKNLKYFPGGDFDPAWSPDGQTIAFTSLRDNNIPHLYLYNLSDNTATRLSAPANREHQPSWSADGTMLAHQTTRQGKSQIWILDLGTMKPREFSSLEGASDYHPDWAPDGSVIVFSQASPTMLVARVVGVSSITTQTILSTTVRPADNVSYSPDGWWLLFDTRKDGVFSIQRMPPNGGDSSTPVLQDEFNNFDPVWKP